MTRREMLLAAAVLSMLVLWGGYHMLGQHRRTLSARQSELFVAQEQLSDARLAIARGEEATLRMESWQERSLPENREAAQSLYRDWLLGKLREAGLTVDNVKPDQRTPRSTAYATIGGTVEAHGRLEAVTRFLHAFYSSDILQQITRLTLRPATDPAQLSVTLSVEALIVPGATHTNSLPETSADQSGMATLADYEKSIAGRNVFAVYTPPRPKPDPTVVRSAPPPPKFDDAGQAYVTAIVQAGPRLEAWITVRTTGEVLRLHEGDAVKVGLLEGEILSISPRSLILQIGDQRQRIELGHNLRDGSTAASPSPSGRGPG
jgi:hypothetical protein